MFDTERVERGFETRPTFFSEVVKGSVGHRQNSDF